MEEKNNFIIRKSNGDKEYFSFEKLTQSLINSGASLDTAKGIVEVLKEKIHQGITTNKIHSMAFRMLKKHSLKSASCYYLKKGIMELGPTGYPFETFISYIFREQNYHTERSVILQGKCVSHEIDVIARKEEEIMIMECKYKNTSGVAVDVKVPLYINSRFQDILDNGLVTSPFNKYKGWIVTNSRFTEDAKQFAKCKGIHLLSWDYPFNNSLKKIIDTFKLYPVTCLNTITKNEKSWLLNKKIVLVKELINNKKSLINAGVSSKRLSKVMNEINNLCQTL